MGNSPLKTINTQPQTTLINSFVDYIYIENIENSDNQDTLSIATTDFYTTQRKNSQSSITEIKYTKVRQNQIIFIQKTFSLTDINQEIIGINLN
ncbi:unnamed protein product [Paramecium sonneborni]|uniref:Uncharacterized protein n=1 Tax=Paramecium sonneborni TaxID=65129 RepID=A0A8S1QXH7_9CILI|nr:unnamed protein product [Paramecium sonneborni]